MAPPTLKRLLGGRSDDVDGVFGHSSHHPLPIELHGDRLILYGCGDLINDDEGLPAHAPWRSDLVCLYGVEPDSVSGALRSLSLHPFEMHRFRLRKPLAADRHLLAQQMGLESLSVGGHWQEHGGFWRLKPQRSTSAAF
jgi:poly-gamma-glutamate synthesis protein (capsule biosynthesis protein)